MKRFQAVVDALDGLSDYEKRRHIAVLYDELFDNYFKVENPPPFIPFKNDWDVLFTAPFYGASARFRIAKRGGGLENSVSVYLDRFGMLGAVDHPYWELFPYDGDVFRCDMDDVESLVEAIEKSLNDIEEGES